MLVFVILVVVIVVSTVVLIALGRYLFRHLLSLARLVSERSKALSRRFSIDWSREFAHVTWQAASARQTTSSFIAATAILVA